MTISDVQSFLTEIARKKPKDRLTAYRGHSNKAYLLQPKIYRFDKAKKNEERILSELLSESPDDFREDHSVFDRLVRAQHFGLPTRLLDATLNPLVALYFACRNGTISSPDGEVIRFSISQDRVKLFDSDTLSCISNLARLSYAEKNEIFMHFGNTKGAGGVSSIDRVQFNERPDVKRLVQFIRTEKPYFQNEINPIDLNRFFYVTPKKNNKRILAQSGAFITSGMLKNMTEESSTAFEQERFVIGSFFKEDILAELDDLHINERTLFPEIEKAAEYIAKKYSS